MKIVLFGIACLFSMVACSVNTVEGPNGKDGTCPSGGCTFVAPAGETSNFTCSGGGCSMHCPKGSHCNNTCSGGHCTIRCDEGSTCNNTCSGNGCDVVCAPDVCTNG